MIKKLINALFRDERLKSLAPQLADENIIKNLTFLVGKSREILQEQLKSYENYTAKSGILISVYSFLLPAIFAFFSTIESLLVIKLFALIPAIAIIIALFFFLNVLKPKGLSHGFTLEEFNNYVTKDYKELLTFEIRANKSSFNSNLTVLKRHKFFYIWGVNLVIWSSVILLLLIAANIIFTELKTCNENNLHVKSVIIENMNIPDEKTEQSSQSQDSSSSSSDYFPDVDDSQRLIIDKGEDSDSIVRK